MSADINVFFAVLTVFELLTAGVLSGEKKSFVGVAGDANVSEVVFFVEFDGGNVPVAVFGWGRGCGGFLIEAEVQFATSRGPK